MLIPSIASLRGSLTLDSVELRFLDPIITLYGELHFRYVCLRSVVGAQLVLDACAKTLRTLRPHPDNESKNFLWMEREGPKLTCNSVTPHVNLSRLQSLRTLELPALNLGRSFLETVLPTIAPSSCLPPNVVIICDQSYFVRLPEMVSNFITTDQDQRERFAVLVRAYVIREF